VPDLFSQCYKYVIQTKKINKEISELNNTIDQKDLMDVYRIFQSTATNYAFCSAASGTFSKMHCILGHKASVKKYKKIEIASCILSHHNKINLEVNRKELQKIFKHMEIEQYTAKRFTQGKMEK
jgi:hypothetical protein